MKKAIFACILAIICFSMSSFAMECSIKPAAECTGDDVKVLRITNPADGGSHAGREGYSSYTDTICCSGLPGLTVSQGPAGEFMSCITDNNDAHVNRTGTEDDFTTCLYLEAPTEITCAYMDTPTVCPGFETCLFSISEDSTDYSHVSGCESDEFPFDEKYCCRTGEATCTITNIYWGIWDETTEELTELAEPPVCPVGLDMPVFLIAETSGCEGTTAEFTIYDNTDTEYLSSANLHGAPVEMGMLNDVTDLGDPNVVATFWENAGKGNDGISSTDTYKFKVVLTSTDPVFTTTSTYSPDMKVDDSCSAKNPITDCATTITEAQIAQCTAECTDPEPTPCPDADCDTVADCIDEIITTPADCSTVGECSGYEAGTAGCIPAMDCTNLLWSECKNCEAGEECNKPTSGGGGGFSAGTMFMERTPCTGPGEGKCDCFWDANRDDVPDATAPPGCDLPGVLNQYNNRFKECIEEQEFPVFDGFNVVAVLLILSMYYAIVIIRKKK